jgi:hypothetical protein
VKLLNLPIVHLGPSLRHDLALSQVGSYLAVQ